MGWQRKIEKNEELQKKVGWPNNFQESTDFHGLGGMRSKIAVPRGIRKVCRFGIVSSKRML